MKISIITTGFNAQKYLEETIESVVTQRGNFELEYILIDAKSNDSTLEIMQKYQKRAEQGWYKNYNQNVEIKVISEADEGMYHAIGKGLKLVTGEVVAYINSDDFYLPNAFSCVCDVFEKFKQVNWLTGRTNTYNSKGQNWESILPAHYYKDILLKGFYGRYLPIIQQESTFWRKSLSDAIVLEEFMSYKLAGDYYLWHKFAKTNQLYILNSNLGGFRSHEGQKSSDRINYAKEFDSINNFYKPNLIDKLMISWLKKSRILSDKRKIRRNKNIISFDLAQNCWILK